MINVPYFLTVFLSNHPPSFFASFLIGSFIHPTIYDPIHDPIHPPIHPSIYSLFIHSFIHSFKATFKPLRSNSYLFSDNHDFFSRNIKERKHKAPVEVASSIKRSEKKEMRT